MGNIESTLSAIKIALYGIMAAVLRRLPQQEHEGPALAGTEARWSKYPRKDLYNYIRTAQAMLKAKHPIAVEGWKKWQPTVMNDFTHLSDGDVENLLAYINAKKI